MFIKKVDVYVDSVAKTEIGEVLVKASTWNGDPRGKEISIHFICGMYGAPKVGQGLTISIEDQPQPQTPASDPNTN